MGASVSYAVTAGDYNFTNVQAAYFRILITGTLTDNVRLILPAGLGGRRYFFVIATLGGYTITVLNGASDARGGVLLPYRLYCPIVFAADMALYDNYQSVPPGTIHCYAGATAPAGFLLCIGSSLSITGFHDLFLAIGYTYGGSGSSFSIPDTRGRILAGADDMGGSAAGRLTGYTIATAGGEQTHVLSTAELAAHNHGVTDPGHLHAINDPGHAHTVVALQNGGGTYSMPGGGAINLFPTLTTSTSATGVAVWASTTGITTGNNGSYTAHNNIQPTIAVNHIIRW